MEDKREDNQNCSVLCCVHDTHTREQFLHCCMLVRFRFFMCLFSFCVFFHVSLGHFVLVLLAFVVLGLVCGVRWQGDATGRALDLRSAGQQVQIILWAKAA